MANIGGQIGNNNAYTGRKAKQALEIAVRRESTGQDGECIEAIECLVQIWLKAIEKAKEDGDIPALNAIMDRLDGKPRQTIDANIKAMEVTDLSDSELGNIATSGGEGTT